MKKFRVFLYWVSVIPPLFDVLKGAVIGVKKGLEDIRQKADKDMQDKFDQANR